MALPKKTLYQILGVPRDAEPEAIALAHEMKSAEMQQRVPPDPSGVALVNQAYEVLSNPQRRAAYEASLVTAAEKAAAQQQALEQQAADLEVGEAEAVADDRRRKMRIAAMVGGVAVIFVILFLAIKPRAPAPAPVAEVVEAPKPAPPPPPKMRTGSEILADASTSGGQVLSYSMSGSGAPVGIALSVEPGQMVTTCHGLPAGAKLVVKVGPQLHPADLTITDEELDLCRLSVAGFTTPPLKVATEEAKAGDKVFVFGMNAKGEAATTEGKVSQVRNTKRGRILEVSVPIAPTGSGGGVFNEQGQLVGIATTPHDYGSGMNVALPVSWIGEMRSRTTTPAK